MVRMKQYIWAPLAPGLIITVPSGDWNDPGIGGTASMVWARLGSPTSWMPPNPKVAATPRGMARRLKRARLLRAMAWEERTQEEVQGIDDLKG